MGCDAAARTGLGVLRRGAVLSPTVTIELPESATRASYEAVDAALGRGDRVAVDATLCPVLWNLAARALSGPHGPQWAGLVVTLTFPDRLLVVYDGGEYTVYATPGDRVMGRGVNTGRVAPGVLGRLYLSARYPRKAPCIAIQLQ